MSKNGLTLKSGYGGPSRSLKIVRFDRRCMTFAIVTIAASLAISPIFSIKEWPDLEIWVWGRSRSFKRRCSIDHVQLSIGRPLQL